MPLLAAPADRPGGSIVNITSIEAHRAAPAYGVYSAMKAGVANLTKTLSLELASRGITVNSVAPGIIETGMSSAAFDAKAIAQLVPVKRAGRPEEVAGLVSYLASDEAAYITGQVISINGGMI